MTRRFLAMFLLALAAAPGVGQEQPEGGRIESVEFRGNQRVGTDYLMSQIRTLPGEAYDPRVVDEDIRRLAGLGLFSNIEVEQRRTSKGYRVTFLMEENVLVHSIEFVGVEELEEDDIRPLVKLRTGQPLVRYLLHLDKDRIRKHYLEEGYLFVEVDVDIRSSLTGEDVVFLVREGPEVEVDDLRFVGNETFDEDEFEDFMQTQESWFLSSEKFQEARLHEDIVTLKAFYRSKGFFDVEVNLQDIHVSPDLEEVTAVIFVEEGPRYKVNRIEIEGVRLFEKREFLERFRQKEGEFFDQEDILKDKNRVEDVYGQNAFLEAEADIDFFYAAEGNEVTLVYNVTEGRPYRIGRVDFKGNLFTRDDVMRRYIRQLPGQWANTVKMKDSTRRLEALGYFESVKMIVEDGRRAGEKILVYQVEEGQTGSLRLAAGVTSNVGFLGDVSFTKQNFDIADLPKSWDDLFSGGAFTGGGQELSLQVQPGTELFRARLGFREPYLFGYPYSFSTNLQYFTREYESYEVTRLGGDVGIGHEIFPHLMAELTYRNEVVEIDDVDDDAPSFVQRSKGKTNITSFTQAFDYDRRDDPILPTEGYRLGLSGEYAAEAFGGDENFYKVDARGEQFFTVYRTESGYPFVFGLSGRFGFGDAVSPTTEIPISERYFAGGSGSIRGFKFRGVGPMEAGDPIGGEVMALASVEHSFPLFKDFLRGVVFVDAGTVAREFNNSEFGKWRAAAGFGVRVKIPFLGQKPIAVDLGFPLRSEDDDEEEIVSFSLGRSF